MEQSSKRCSLSNCPVNETGKCLEGLDISLCPNYGVGSQTEQVKLTKPSVKLNKKTIQVETETDFISLSDGLDFDPVTAEKLTRKKLIRVIVLAGESDSGKTTLLSSLYNKFQQGPFAGYYFAGSQTIFGLEKRCFPSRLKSDRIKPITLRTPRTDGQKFLHLSLRKIDLLKKTQDILIADISGEFFRDACDSTEACQELKVLSRADHISICLDGDKLINNSTKHGVYHSGKMLLQSGIDANMLDEFSSVDILFTKCDKFGINKTQEIDGYLKFIRESYVSEFQNKLGSLNFYEVASRPDNENFPLAYGLDKLLNQWIEETPFYKDVNLSGSTNLIKSLARIEFDKYFERHLLSDKNFS